MKTITRRRYGPPDALSCEEIERPTPGDEDVLIRVHAAGASIGDYIIVTGKPWLIRLTPFGGFPHPRKRVPGACMSGRVESVGANVTSFRPGDAVFGDAIGAFAEYVAVSAKRIAHKPANLSFEEAAAVPWAVAALQGLRDLGGLKAGQRLLINGASGGVGTWAVQIAKAMGTHVTGVCSTRNVDMVRSLGADEVIDYTQRDFSVASQHVFDVVFDTVGNRSLSDCLRVLKPEGVYVSCSGGDSGIRWLFGLFMMRLTSLFTRQKLKALATSPNRDDLLCLKALVEAGDLKPVIERCFPLSQVGDALRHVGSRRSQGQTVIQIASESPTR